MTNDDLRRQKLKTISDYAQRGLEKNSKIVSLLIV